MDGNVLHFRKPVMEDDDLIPAIYNYCDTWCERCRFTTRCRVFRRRVPEGRNDDLGAGAGGRELSTDQTPPADWLRDLDFTVTDEELEAFARREEARLGLANADPLVVQARSYLALAAPIVSALEPVLIERGNPVELDALAVVGHLMWTISAKVYRAVCGSLDDDRDPDFDPRDDLGSAKVARIAIRDSRFAWRVLMTVGRASADGVPARLAASLDVLDGLLAERFPAAMAFVRPGFDTEGRDA